MGFPESGAREQSVIALELPAKVYSELQALAAEEQTEPAALVADLVVLLRERRAWQRDLARLREQILQNGSLQVGANKEEVVARLRQTRQQIFDAEYAYLY